MGGSLDEGVGRKKKVPVKSTSVPRKNDPNMQSIYDVRFIDNVRAGERFFRAHAIFLVDFFWQVWLNVLSAGVAVCRSNKGSSRGAANEHRAIFLVSFGHNRVRVECL